MGINTLNCKHEKRKPYYEDDCLMGDIYFGDKCIKCGHIKYPPPGPLELGTYR